MTHILRCCLFPSFGCFFTFMNLWCCSLKEAMKEVVKSKELTVDADSAMEPFLEAINEGLEDIASISETNKCVGP